jgi:hypothetical protein
MITFTFEDYKNGNFDKNLPVFIHTAWGYKEVTGMRWPDTNAHVVCGKDNGGFGMSYMVSWQTQLFQNVEDK